MDARDNQNRSFEASSSKVQRLKVIIQSNGKETRKSFFTIKAKLGTPGVRSLKTFQVDISQHKQLIYLYTYNHLNTSFLLQLQIEFPVLQLSCLHS